MKTSNEGLVEIIGHEGICLSKYLDSVGVWTIGVGATRSEISDLASWPLSKTLSIQEVFDLFKKSIVKYENAVNSALTRPILQYQFDALVSWCYNVGVGYTRPPKVATVIKLLNQGTSPKELYNALLLYRKPPEIVGRRTKEANLLAYGKYSNDGKALMFPVSSKGIPIYKKGTSINVWQYISHTSDVNFLSLNISSEEEDSVEKPSLLKRCIKAVGDILNSAVR